MTELKSAVHSSIMSTDDAPNKYTRSFPSLRPRLDLQKEREREREREREGERERERERERELKLERQSPRSITSLNYSIKNDYSR